jgi:hypothetical protein
MSLGKDSIQKRVAKAADATKKAPTKKAPAKKTAPRAAVLTNVAPETVEKVIAHKEGTGIVKISLGQALPPYLL